MRVLVIGILLLSSSLVFSQKCKYKINEEDPMTGSKKLMTEFIIDNCRFNMLRTGDKIEFKATYYLENERNIILPAGTELSMRLGDGTFLKVKSSKKSPPISNAAGGTVSTRYVVMYDATVADLELIKANGVLAASTQLDSEWVRKVKEKQTEKSKNAARCLLQ